MPTTRTSYLRRLLAIATQTINYYTDSITSKGVSAILTYARLRSGCLAEHLIGTGERESEREGEGLVHPRRWEGSRIGSE